MLLSFDKTKELLSNYELPLAETEPVETLKEASSFAEENGYPQVLKVFSSNVLHRTEENLLKTGIENREQLEKSFNDLKERIEDIDSARILIQNQEQGIELVYGMKKDETFGPVLMFGLGGIFVEVLKDISFGITPLREEEAKDMIRSIKGFKVLKGFRGYPEVDLDKATGLLIKLSRLSEEEKEIKEIDFNPVFAKGKSIKIADPKIIV